MCFNTVKLKKNLDTPKNAVINLKFEPFGYAYNNVSRNADKMTSSVDPDQTTTELIMIYTVCPDLSVINQTYCKR